MVLRLLGAILGAAVSIALLRAWEVGFPWLLFGSFGTGFGLLLSTVLEYRYRVHQRDTILREQNERLGEVSLLNRQLQSELNRQVALDHHKTRFFTNLNHDLRSPLTVI